MDLQKYVMNSVRNDEMAPDARAAHAQKQRVIMARFWLKFESHAAAFRAILDVFSVTQRLRCVHDDDLTQEINARVWWVSVRGFARLGV